MFKRKIFAISAVKSHDSIRKNSNIHINNNKYNLGSQNSQNCDWSCMMVTLFFFFGKCGIKNPQATGHIGTHVPLGYKAISACWSQFT